MLNREDLLELTRRMTLKRNCFSRIAGAYMDQDGFVDGTFNTHFLSLSAHEKEKNMAIAKTIPFSETNVNLKEYHFAKEDRGPGSIWQLLMGMRECGLKNDALMDVFYELIGETYQADADYAIFVFHGAYDIPAKAADKERLWESEEVYNFMICAICPLAGEYEPGPPECGFMFPAFSDRTTVINGIAVFQADPDRPHKELVEAVLGL